MTFFIQFLCVSGSWDSHIITPPTLFQTSSEIVLHGPLKEVHGSTSEGTAIDSDREIKLVLINILFFFCVKIKICCYFFRLQKIRRNPLIIYILNMITYFVLQL